MSCSTIAADTPVTRLAWCCTSSYQDDPRFDPEYMLNAEDDDVAFGLRKSLSVVVQWITNMLECRKLYMEMENCDYQIQQLKDGEKEWEEQWKAKQVCATAALGPPCSPYLPLPPPPAARAPSRSEEGGSCDERSQSQARRVQAG